VSGTAASQHKISTSASQKVLLTIFRDPGKPAVIWKSYTLQATAKVQRNIHLTGIFSILTGD